MFRRDNRNGVAGRNGESAGGSFWPVLTVLLFLLALWHVGAVWLNAGPLLLGYERKGEEWTAARLVADAYAMERPLLPAPHQLAAELWDTIFARDPTSKRSLVYHSAKTLAPTVLGFLLGLLLGTALAAGMVYNRALESALLPWVVASQTIPLLALAPMIIVVLASLGLTGLLPKAVISMYLSFFPVTIGMVKGLRAPEPMQVDLLRTYAASGRDFFFKLRLPASAPFLFASLKVAAAAALVGAIVGELPTGARGGLGARLLSGSYYGQTIQIWSALLTAALLGGGLVFLVGAAERLCRRSRGER